MADPFSTVAAAVSLAPIALQAVQAGLQLYNAISKLRTASAELRRLNHDLDVFLTIISDIQSFCTTHDGSAQFSVMHGLFCTIENRLSCFVQDVTQLQLVVENTSDKDDTRMNRFGMRVKSVLNEQMIMELSTRLTAHKVTIQLALTVVLGYDEQRIKKSLSHIAKGITSLHEGQITLKAGVSESFARFESRFSMIRQDMSTLECLIRNLDKSQLFAAGQGGKAVFLLHGSVTDGAASLEVICPEIHRILLPSGPGVETAFPRDIGLWFRSQLHIILADILKEELDELMIRPGGPCSGSAFQCSSTIKSSRSFHVDVPPRCAPKSLALVFPIETMLVEIKIPSGNISLIVKKECADLNMGTSRNQRMIGRTVFIPTQESCLAGITAEFTRNFHASNQIPRILSTFGIHLDNSPIFEYIKEGNTPMVRKMLANRCISPNDWDQDGKSLHWHAISDNYNYEMCRVLLEEGAEVADCNKFEQS